MRLVAQRSEQQPGGERPLVDQQGRAAEQRRCQQRILPDTDIDWRDVWLGAALTAALFEIGKFLIGLYVGTLALQSPYGAATSLVMLLIWVYYSSQIFLLGAEFTHVYAGRYAASARPIGSDVAFHKAG